MTADNIHHRPNPRREKAARRAFILWMAAYAVALVALVTLYGLGGEPAGLAGQAAAPTTQQARVTGEPQSSLADPMLPVAVTLKVDG